MKHIIVVDQRRIDAQLLSRNAGGWTAARLDRPEARISLPDIGIEFALGDLYAGVALDD